MTVNRIRAAFIGLFLALPMGCAEMNAKNDALPPMRWDHRPEASLWTTKALAAIDNSDSLPSVIPADIGTWCPGYADAKETDREAFWAGLMSALAKHESTWNPRASGGGGAWIGLLQISPATARQYGCEATTSAALKDGAANLSCAVKIASVQVQRDGMVAGGGARGMGRDWAPFRNSSKRAEMAAWTRAQSYCQKKPASILGGLSVPKASKAS
ncbi:MAG: lytic transglycosylase [Cereibacter sphaeroides]|uniref:Lytic transglycosylase n=1 Tax=Cereibacter sphaeroides TaxID=1063 RepID=A0A2W5S4A9_CERSP|nr:MAG: lytic transglycosylase [Cereibacter sphaeroides]